MANLSRIVQTFGHSNNRANIDLVWKVLQQFHVISKVTFDQILSQQQYHGAASAD